MRARLELFHKNRSTHVDGSTFDEMVHDLFESANWFRLDPQKKVSTEEKEQITLRLQLLQKQQRLSGTDVRLPLRFFVSDPSVSSSPRIGLEAEYPRGVRALDPTTTKLKYEQLLATILSQNTVLAKIKLDGIDGNLALLELECRPFSIDSKEFFQQRQSIGILKKAISEIDKDSNVQDMIKALKLDSNIYEIQLETDEHLVFGDKCSREGPFVQVTLELSLRRFGDPEDTAILNLIGKIGERKLLQYARKAAADLAEILKPMASEFYSRLYKTDSIKLAKLRGYLAQTIMQACQVIYYNKKKESVEFHIRAAGPIGLSARDKHLLNKLFNVSNRGSQVQETFKTTLKQALKNGIIEIAAGGPLTYKSDIQRDIEHEIKCMVSTIMNDGYSFEARSLQFKSDSLFGKRSLEFRYGMTLVELRDVHSFFNKGVLEDKYESYERIKKAQALQETRPCKTLSI